MMGEGGMREGEAGTEWGEVEGVPLIEQSGPDQLSEQSQSPLSHVPCPPHAELPHWASK